jgi:hypothetical protein
MSVNILDALRDKRLFASAIRDKKTWGAWRAFLAVMFGLPLSADAELYRQCTGRAELPPPGQAFAVAWLVCGRRGGKSLILALVAVYLAAFRDYRPYLTLGERATIMVIAADRKQARVIMRYIRGLLAIPALKTLVESETADSIDLTNQVTIEVGTASYKTIRGYTIACALCDEIAFWPQEDSATPDVEILAALAPAMATIPGSMLLCASSPYSRRGALWDAYRKYYGSSDPSVLVWKASTRVMNPTIPQRRIDEEFEKDAAKASAEYGAEFRTDVESFINRELIESAIDRGVLVRPPKADTRYCGFVDAASGTGRDAFTVAITHNEDGTIILDLAHEIKPPFNPQVATADVVKLLKSYHIGTVVGDKYAAGFVIEAFAKHGVTYRYSTDDRSEIYLNALPLLTSGRARLLDNDRMLGQFCALERRTSTSGRDKVDHPRDQHDDLANAVAGALVGASKVVRDDISFHMPDLISGGLGGELRRHFGEYSSFTPDFTNRQRFS